MGLHPPSWRFQTTVLRRWVSTFHLLGQAKLLETIDITTHGDTSPNALALGITWDGYDFLEAAKNEAIWKKATDALTHSGVGVTLEILKALLIDFSKKAVGLP
jgi:hypothetical protein